MVTDLDPSFSTAELGAGAVGEIGKKIVAAASRIGSSALDRAKIKLEIGVRPYLEVSHGRCRFYKTLLNPYEPCDLDQTYIHVSLTSKSTSENVEDLALIYDFLDSQKIVVTGLAGCGKSMFMRFATLRTFESSKSLPLFIELRKLNGRKDGDLLRFIYDECTPQDRGVTYRQFKIALRSGLFALILDGFDEIEYDLRRHYSEKITEITVDFPEAPILISSRPDNDVFGSWTAFEVYEVEKFNRRQTRELVENAKYDCGVKARFLESLETKLFETHGDFLQSPLLTIIMLLTYEEFAEIPNKMHAFYARAFDTLFQKHDADKEQFVRKIKTGLSREDFKQVLASFCAISYIAEKFSFNATELQGYVDKGIKYSNNVIDDLSITSFDFISDLRDAVCIIQEDGLNFVFVHRSFQEYFTAVFLDKMHESKVAALADKLSERFNDNVLPMALDLSREKLEVEWVLPTIEKFIKFFDPKQGKRNTGRTFAELLGNVVAYADHLHGEDEADRYFSFGFENLPKGCLGPLEFVCKSYPRRLGAAFPIKSIRGLKTSQARRLIMDEAYVRRKSYKTFRTVFENNEGQQRSQIIEVTSADSWWLDKLGFSQTFDELHAILKELRDEIQTRVNERQRLLENFLME